MVISCSYFAGLIFSCMSRKLKDMIMYSISTTTPNLLMLDGQGSWKGQGPLWPITYPWCGDYILRLYQMLMQTWPWWMVFTLNVLSVHFLFHFMKDVEFTYKGISNQFAVVLWIFTYFFSEFPNRTLYLCMWKSSDANPCLAEGDYLLVLGACNLLLWTSKYGTFRGLFQWCYCNGGLKWVKRWWRRSRVSHEF